MADQLAVDMIVQAIAEGFDKLNQQVNASGNAVEKTNEKIDDSSKKAKKSIGDLGKGLNNTVQELTGFNIAQLGAAGALALVAKEVGASIRFTADYAEQIRTLSAATGMNNQETAKMIQLFDDANVDIGALESASKKLLQNGLSPSIETIATLADKYNALNDPVARGKLLMDNFGKAGMDMGKLLEMGSDAIREAGEAAEKAGQVMSDDALRGAEEYRQALDNLGDAAEGVKIKVGSRLLPVLADAINLINDWTEATQEHTDTFGILDEALVDGIITQEEYNSMVVTSVTGTKTFKGSSEQLAEIQGRVKDLYERSIPVISDYAINMGEVASATDDANAAAEWSDDVFRAAGEALAESNIPLAEKVKLQEALALASGKVTAAELEMEREIAIITGMLAAGAITQDTYEQAVRDVADGTSWAVVQQDLLRDAVEKAGGAAEDAQVPAGELALGMQNLATDLGTAKDKADALKQSIDKLHDKTITVTTQYKLTGTVAAPGGGNPKPGTGCFVADTQVNVPGGTMRIADLQVGDFVMAYDEPTGQVVVKSILAKIVMDDQAVYEVATSHGEFRCTELHRWYTRRGWVETRYLTGADAVLLLDGSYASLALAPRRCQGEHTVYNLTVEDAHTYFVDGHCVHNAKGQFGLNQVVPPGYPNDSYPVFASSGEKVMIIPNRTVAGLTPPDLMHTLPQAGGGGLTPAMSGGSAGSDSGVAILDNSTTINEFHNYSRAAAAISTAMAMNSRLRRLNDRMG